ncbi:MAG: YdeI/OmpD-associated family protein [Pyrinomonadaceae bacterium]
MEKQIFRTQLEKEKRSEACTISLPFDVEQIFGAKRVPACGTINDTLFRTTIFKMHGRYFIPVNKELREAAGIKAGDFVNVEIERDRELRIVEPPSDLLAALNTNATAKNVWEKLSFTHQKEFVKAIKEAKREETRRNRIEKTINKLIAAKI